MARRGEVSVVWGKRSGRLPGRVAGSGVTLALAVALVVSSPPRPAHAQQDRDDRAACPEGGVIVGELGIAGLACNCTYRTGEAGRPGTWLFRSEPEILAVRPGSPADGVLRKGDRIVAVDDLLITTSEAGKRFANLPPGARVKITFRRGGSERSEVVQTQTLCSTSEGSLTARAPRAHGISQALPPAPAPPATGIAAGTDAPTTAPAARAVPVPEAAAATRAAPSATPPIVPAAPIPPLPSRPRGWFGFGIRCSDCSWSVTEGSLDAVFEFSAPPVITSVDPGGPAERAGLMRGDVLTHIDGLELTSEEGGRLFGSVEPGQQVNWTYVRGGVSRRTRATAAGRPTASGIGSETPRAEAAVPRDVPAPQPAYGLRYAGVVGNTEVEVRAAGSVVVHVVDPGREIEIVTSDSRTLIRVSGSPEK